MSEGRKTQIVLLDDRRLEILIQPKLYAGELLDLVASHFQLREKDYFGLCFKDDTGHQHWLQLDRRVLEHDFPRGAGPLILYFAVRFFIESIAYLRDNSTIELFYLQAKSSVYKGFIDCDSEHVFELAAHVLQATSADYNDEAKTRKCMKKLPVLPTTTLQEHPSLGYCEDRITEHYRKLAGQTRGAAIVNYMTIIESLPTYGIHYYEVKDKSGIPWWLGLSYKGILLYDYSDKKTPRRVFAWKQLENLYFRDKKFSIEVHDPKRIVHTLSSFNLYEDAILEPIDQFDELSDAISDPTTQVSVSRRTFGPGNVNVHAWFAATPQLTKCIWSMAVSQHQFYLDRKQSKSALPAVRSMSEIAADLCQSSSSLHSSDTSLSRSNSAHSLSLITSQKTQLTSEELEAARAAQREMYTALKARRQVLEEALRKRTDELRALCIKEGELTGELPAETPHTPGEPLPPIRRRVRTGFSLSPQVLNKQPQDEDMLSKLEIDYELQNKITEAALKLAKDPTVAKSVRRKRKQSYNKAQQKLKDVEKKLNDYRRQLGRTPLQQRHYSSVEDLSEDSREFLDSEPEVAASPVSSPAPQHRVPQYQIKPHYPIAQPLPTAHVKIIASPKVEVVEVEQPATLTLSHSTAPTCQATTPVAAAASRGSTPSPGTTRPYPSSTQGPGGYVPNAVYTTQYRRCMYPSYKASSAASSQSEYDNVDVPHNLYNLNTHRTSRYDSCDELKSPPPEVASPGDDGDMDALTPSRFGSKRESHSDYRDSPYYSPEPAGQYGIPAAPLPTIPYIDSSHSSLASSASSAVVPPYPYHGPTEPNSHPTSPTYPAPYNPNYSGGAGDVSVTKYQNYVEVSKPFEMADVYKYSERRRRQRHTPSPHQSPYLPRAAQPSSAYNTTPHSPQRQMATSPHRTSLGGEAGGEVSFGSFDSEYVSEAFSEEMLTWYNDQPTQHRSKSSTLV